MTDQIRGVTEMIKITPGHFRKGRQRVISGPLAEIRCGADDAVTAEVRGLGEDRWVYFYKRTKRLWSCNPTYFACHFFYVVP